MRHGGNIHGDETKFLVVSNLINQETGISIHSRISLDY